MAVAATGVRASLDGAEDTSPTVGDVSGIDVAVFEVGSVGILIVSGLWVTGVPGSGFSKVNSAVVRLRFGRDTGCAVRTLFNSH